MRVVGRIIAGCVRWAWHDRGTQRGMGREHELRALAVANARRLAVAPDIVTMAEAGLPGVEATGWNGMR